MSLILKESSRIQASEGPVLLVVMDSELNPEIKYQFILLLFPNLEHNLARFKSRVNH